MTRLKNFHFICIGLVCGSFSGCVPKSAVDRASNSTLNSGGGNPSSIISPIPSSPGPTAPSPSPSPGSAPTIIPTPPVSQESALLSSSLLIADSSITPVSSNGRQTFASGAVVNGEAYFLGGYQNVKTKGCHITLDPSPVKVNLDTGSISHWGKDATLLPRLKPVALSIPWRSEVWFLGGQVYENCGVVNRQKGVVLSLPGLSVSEMQDSSGFFSDAVAGAVSPDGVMVQNAFGNSGGSIRKSWSYFSRGSGTWRDVSPAETPNATDCQFGKEQIFFHRDPASGRDLFWVLALEGVDCRRANVLTWDPQTSQWENRFEFSNDVLGPAWESFQAQFLENEKQMVLVPAFADIELGKISHFRADLKGNQVTPVKLTAVTDVMRRSNLRNGVISSGAIHSQGNGVIAVISTSEDRSRALKLGSDIDGSGDRWISFSHVLHGPASGSTGSGTWQVGHVEANAGYFAASEDQKRVVLFGGGSFPGGQAYHHRNALFLRFR